MAMNKKEQAEMEALRQERDMYRAMCISADVQPDVLPDGIYTDGGFDKGWLPCEYHDFFKSGGAVKAATNRVFHRTGSDSWKKENTSWSQGSRKLYSKKSMALKASRHWASMDMAKRLMLLDRDIEAAEQEERG